MSDLLYVVGDLETYYNTASGYSLRAKGMDIPSYILSPEFEAIGCAFKVNGQKTGWVDGPDIPRFLSSLGDPSRVVFIAHHLLFDGSIFSWCYGWVAGFYVDTLALSRALLGYVLRRHDLDTVARYLGVGSKGTTIHKVNGLNRQAIIDAGFYNEYAEYSCGDADLCWGIFKHLAPVMPVSELQIWDIVHRMALQPVLKLDQLLLHEHLANVRAEKELLLQEAGIADKADLMSDQRFADILIGMGVTPPTKISLRTEEETWAFAKTDEGMKALLEHPDHAVQAVTAARLGVKTTIEESRTARFINLSGLTFPHYGTNLMPVALKPSGAHTHRLSGDWKLNQQNLTRENKVRKRRAALRESIVTPEGYSMVVADARQIELRGTAMFCGQESLLAALRDLKRDPYSEFASRCFGYLVTKADIGPRFCGKTGMLSCQYQVGWRKYRGSVRHLSVEQIGTLVDLSAAEAQLHVNIYRTDNFNITGMWKILQYRVIPAMTRPDCDFMLGPVRVMFEKIVLPNGMCLHYHGLHKSQADGNWLFTYGWETKRLYGGKLLENIIQALCKIIVMDVALRVKKPFEKLFEMAALKMQSHDELMYVCRDQYAPELKGVLMQELRVPPTWWPEIPLDVEAEIGTCYGKVK